MRKMTGASGIKIARTSPSIEGVFRLYLLAFTFFPLLLLAAYLFYQVYLIRQEETFLTLEGDRKRVEELTHNFYDRSEESLAHLAEGQKLAASLRAYRMSQEPGTSSLDSAEEIISEYVSHLSQYVLEVLIVDVQTGECVLDSLIGSSLSSDAPSKVGEDLSHDLAVVKGATELFSLPMIFDPRFGKVVITQGVPFDPGRGHSYVIVQNIDAVQWLLEVEAEHTAGKATSIYVFTSDGVMLAPTSKMPIEDAGTKKTSLALDLARLGGTGGARYLSHTGHLVLGSYTILRGKRAIIITEIKFVRFLAELNNISMIILPALFILTLVIFVLSTHLARRFSRPLIQLVSHCRDLAEGEWDRKVEITGVREFELLGNSFNSMSRDFSTLFNARAESEAKYRDLYEKSQDGLYTFDPETDHYILCNRRFAEILGYDFDEMASVHLDEIVPLEERAYANEQRELRQRGECVEIPYELKLRRKDGEEIYVEVYYRPVPDSHLLSGSVRDITKRVTLEKSIIEKNEQLRILNESLESLVGERTKTLLALKELHEKIIANAPVGVLVVDQHLVITYVNELYLDICSEGALPGDVLGYSLIVRSRVIPAGVLEQVEKCLSGKDFYFSELKYTPEGVEDALYLDIWGMPLFGGDEGIEGALILVSDQTKQVKLRVELMNTTRLAATGELAASLAHEINNPLNSIRYNLELAKMDIEETEPEKRMHAGELMERFKVVNQEIDRLGGIVKNLLDLHRAPEIAPSPLDLNSAVSDVVFLMQKEIQEEGVEIHFEPSVGIPEVNGLPGPVKQVVINLLANSLQAIEGEGAITVKTGQSDGYGYFSIEDTGEGIPPEILPRIFEPFFSTKGLTGVGLGLSVCESIVNQFRGKIETDNLPGKGTRFTVYLPLYETRSD